MIEFTGFEINGQSAAGHQIGAIQTAYKISKLYPNELIDIDVLWQEDSFEGVAHQDQVEPYIQQLEYLRRFIADCNFTFNHKKITFEDWHQTVPYWKNFKLPNSVRGLDLKFKNFYERKKNKIVFWRDTFLFHDVVHNFNLTGFNYLDKRNLRKDIRVYKGKRPLSYDEWAIFIDYLKENYQEVVEIEYRTPISEVMYHLQTCEVVLGYMGMWSEHASLLNTPMIHLVDFSNFPRKYLMAYTNRNYKEEELLEKRIYNFSARNYNSITTGNHTLKDFIDINYFKGLVERAKSVSHNRSA